MRMKKLSSWEIAAILLYAGIIFYAAIQLNLIPRALVGLPAEIRTPFPDITFTLGIITPTLVVIAATLITLKIIWSRRKYTILLVIFLFLATVQLVLPSKTSISGDAGLLLEDRGVLLDPNHPHEVGEHLTVIFIFPTDGLISKHGVGVDVDYCPAGWHIVSGERSDRYVLAELNLREMDEGIHSIHACVEDVENKLSYGLDGEIRVSGINEVEYHSTVTNLDLAWQLEVCLLLSALGVIADVLMRGRGS